MSLRVGSGIDIHPFAEGRRLILGGVELPETFGLDGHSDADAVLHAVTDAILGALGAGDIGQYFPSTDERWRGAGSQTFIAEAMRLLRSRGGSIVNIDITVLAQKPRLAPHREKIRQSIAALLGVPAERVSFKATTTDHLGFIGREEGLCAMATGLFELQDEGAS
jgi:2-C-methyl-D-erythritol 4-phosphate cytidylyltransferase/2-C-methyl-D-erythritol 2,4-cyclodiphosphate synthase